MLRLDEPAPGLAFVQANPGEQVYLSITFYLYGDQAAEAAARNQPLWTAWMTERFSTLTPR
jgi:hypothetical protein